MLVVRACVEARREGDGSHPGHESRRAGEQIPETQQTAPGENAVLVGVEEDVCEAVENRGLECFASEASAGNGIAVVVKLDSDVVYQFLR
jgi:hypothetical protein